VPEFDEMFNLRSQANQAFYLSIKKIPNLFGFILCPYAMRIRTLLETKGIAYNMTWVDLRNKPDWFLKISPLGKTPVL
jgi:glutathione S-transferase